MLLQDLLPVILPEYVLIIEHLTVVSGYANMM